MATLHDALQILLPTSWDQVPQSPDALREYVRDIFKSGRLIAESLPDPPPYDREEYHELESQATNSRSRTRIVPSSARVGETDSEITSMQKHWGKPIKMGGAKDNPLGLHVWKLSSNDGKGSWFGRRSIHDGLPFSRWRKKLSSEYEETLKVNRRKIEKGETPDNCIRGIGAEEKIESIEVNGEDGSVLGQVTVYHVSAQFPKPTAPRDFVAMIITSDVGLRIGGTKQPGRSWMMISKPCDHPDVPHKNGYTRGEYESVELIREIPRTTSSSSSSSKGVVEKSKANSHNGDGLVEDGLDAADGEEEETNPVEWIMVTRSDPGGSIPRWMVDKGTPKSVGVDAAKFVNWAVEDDKPQRHGKHSATSPIGTSQSPEIQPKDFADEPISDEGSLSDSDTDSVETDTQSHHGLIASVTGLLNSGLERFAPQAFFDYVPHHRTASGHLVNDTKVLEEEDDQDEHSAPQSKSTISSDTKPRDTHLDQVSLSSAQSGFGIPALDDVPQTDLPPAELMQIAKAGKLTSHEKDLAKLALRKREIDARLETVRSELDKLHIPARSNTSSPSRGIYNDVDSDTSGLPKRTEKPTSTPNSASSKQQSQKTNGNGDSSSGDTPSSERTQKPELPGHIHKAASQLFHEESKLLKQLRKIEGSQLKVASKIEARQRKQVERSEKSKSKSENETLRQEVKDLKKEISRLRAEREKWVDLVSSLQAENKRLAGKEESS
ncbi:uncharacterized protein N7496_009865 [Penicillium cataractarum]|uniref:DUF3074 domain-containing protein n=1 Tax=Penicillium cataractarum TaxID=2100454 RepID=A0A9W9V0B7_9EURO|nr:uncharacterized protein N7496_009865 [Penicillium cataractarum]KAJ5364152.1 hypothetical protein N7496_009865 [Penicillium cataractarum]